MKSALLAQLALCACPPLVAVAATTALPPVKHAVHRATAPRHAHKVAHQAKPAAPNCVLRRQTEASPLPVSDLVRDLTALDPAQPTGEGLETALTNPASSQQSNVPGSVGWASLPPPIVSGGVPGTPSGQPGTPTNPNGPDTTTPGAVPEPASWAMMLFGFGTIGWMLRAARRPKIALGKGLGLGGAAGAAAALDVGTGAMVASAKAGTLGAHALGAAVAKNIGLCVCSAAALTATVATVPPLRHALYAATMPAAERPQSPQPCAPATAAELPASSPARSS